MTSPSSPTAPDRDLAGIYPDCAFMRALGWISLAGEEAVRIEDALEDGNVAVAAALARNLRRSANASRSRLFAEWERERLEAARSPNARSTTR